MADIKLRIELNPNADSETLGNITNANELGSTNENLANTSIGASAEGVFYDIQRASGEGSNGLTWAYGELKFDENGFLDNIEESGAYLESEQNPTQFFWGIVPSSKEYYVKLTFSNATSLKEITILGDKLTKQFPTRAILDGTLEIFSDDPEWNIEFPTEGNSHTIEFTHWNREKYNATITKVAILGKYLYIDKANGLKSVETLSQSSSNPSDIFYGVLPNSGSAEFLDLNGELHDMIVDGAISDSNVKVDVLANENVVGTHYTQDTNYNNQSKVISFEMGDALGSWDTLMYNGYDLVEGSRTAYQMLLSVFESLGYNSTQVDKMLETEIIYGNDNVVGSVKSYLEQIVIQYPYLLSDTYRNTINKFCNLAQLQLLQMDNGELRFVSARPTATASELGTSIVLNARDQFSNFDRTAIVKNKIKSTVIQESVAMLKVKEIAKDGNDGISVTTLGSEEVVLETIPHTKDDNTVYFFIRGNKYRYLISFDVDSSTDIFIKDLDLFRVRLNRRIASKQFLYKENFINTILGNSTSQTTSYADETIYPTVTQKYIDVNTNTFNFIVEVVMGTFDTGVPIDGYTWHTFSTEDYTFSLITDSLETKSQEVSFGEFSNDKTEIGVASEILQTGTLYKGYKMSQIISQNILNDYAEGIADATVTISCSDYYNENGEKAKDWASGQIIEVGDIIAPKKDNLGTPLVNYRNGNEYKWRVKGATFRKGGIPFLDLQVQEIRQP